MDELAAGSGSILISAPGANPGISGITLMALEKDFGRPETGKILFVRGVRQNRIVELVGEENFLTALALVIVCKQIASGMIGSRGAFVPLQVVPAQDFIDQLRYYRLYRSIQAEGLSPAREEF